MPKLFDEAGNQVEAFSQEELDAKLAETKTALETESATKLADLQKQLQDATTQIETLSGTDKAKNMAKLREGRETIEKQIEDLKDKMAAGLGELAKKQDDVALDQRLNLLSDGDPEIMKKIKFEYQRITRPDDTQEEKDKKLSDAYRLAVGSTPSQSVMSRVLGSGGAPNSSPQRGVGSWPQPLVELGKRLGLSDKDFEQRTYARR